MPADESVPLAPAKTVSLASLIQPVPTRPTAIDANANSTPTAPGSRPGGPHSTPSQPGQIAHPSEAPQSADIPAATTAAAQAAEQSLLSAIERAQKRGKAVPREVPISQLPPGLQQHIAAKAQTPPPEPYSKTRQASNQEQQDRLQAQARASLEEQLQRRTVAGPKKPVPVKIPNTYVPRVEELVKRVVDRTLGHKLSQDQQRIKTALEGRPTNAGTAAEQQRLRDYIQAQLEQLPPPGQSAPELQGQAARMFTYLRTTPPLEQLEVIQRLVDTDRPVFELLLRLYDGVAELLDSTPAAPLAETIRGDYAFAHDDWDPYVEQYRRVLWALVAHPQSRIVRIMDVSGVGMLTRSMLDRALAAHLVIREEIGTTGVYTLTTAGTEYLLRTQPAAEDYAAEPQDEDPAAV